MQYQVNQKIGSLTIISYDQESRNYTLQCECGKTTSGGSTHVTKKIGNLLSEGFTACQSCVTKFRKHTDNKKQEDADYYTYKDIYREYVASAKKRNKTFNLSLNSCVNLFKASCFYCGQSPANKRTRENGRITYYQGIDRVDNAIGYEESNVIPCCKHCNSAKQERTQEEFYNHISQIYFRKVQRLEQTLVDSSESKWEFSYDN